MFDCLVQLQFHTFGYLKLVMPQHFLILVLKMVVFLCTLYT